MLKLLKYDWKRNATTLLGALAVLLIVQIAITVSGSLRDWEPEVMMGLSVLGYGSAGVLFLAIVCKTFDNNIKAYHRRLLPVQSGWNILTSLILAIAAIFVLGALLLAHLWYYWRMFGDPLITWNVPLSQIGDWAAAVLHGTWEFIFMMITIFFAIALARSITKKGNVWIGILAFFVLHGILEWLNHMLLGSGEAVLKSGAEDHGEGFSMIVIGGDHTFAWGWLAFDAVVAGMTVYATIYLMDKKIEV